MLLFGRDTGIWMKLECFIRINGGKPQLVLLYELSDPKIAELRQKVRYPPIWACVMC